MTHKNHDLQGIKNAISMVFFCLLLQGIIFILAGTCLTGKLHLENGIILIVTAFCSFIPVGMFLSRSAWRKKLTGANQKISIDKFIFWFMADITLNFIAVQAELPLEKLFGIFGVSAKNVEAENMGLSIAFLIYACLIGPFLEELIYRGALLGTLKRINVTFAVVISAFCFAIMHHDLYQGISAFVGGLVYGYISVRYSFRAGVMLHIVNNSFAMVMTGFKNAGTTGATVILIIVFVSGIVTVIGAIRCTCLFLWKRKKTSSDLKKNYSDNKETISSSILWKNYMFWALVIFDMTLLIFRSFHPVIK